MNIKHLLVGTVILAVQLPAFGGMEELCFKNAGLKDEETVTLNIDETRVTGIFQIMRDYSSDQIEKYEFTGTRTGKTLKVKFKGNKFPSPAMKSLNWTLATMGDKEILKIKVNGKNYDTNKFEDYVADYEACEPSFAELKKKATKLSLDQGGSKGTEIVKFASKDERKAFSFKVPKGKSFGITAPMLNIRFYPPGKTVPEDLGMDSFTSGKVMSEGECLLVLNRYAMPDQEMEETAEVTIDFSLTEPSE